MIEENITKKNKVYLVKASFYYNDKKVCSAYLSHDIFANSIFTRELKDACKEKDIRKAMAMMNKMTVSNYTYYDPIGMKRYNVKWSLCEVKVS